MLTDLIYASRVPAEAKGLYFWYKVQSYEEDDDTFTLVYQKNKALDPNAEQAIFFAFAEDTNELLIDEVDISGVKDAQSRWWNETTKTKRVEADKREEVERQLKEEIKDPTKFDFSDIQQIVDTDEKGAMSTLIIDLEFEQLENDKEPEKKQKWRHKPTGREFFRYKSHTGKTWDTGIWNRQLKNLVEGKYNKKGKL